MVADALRFAIAILLNALAFTVWDVGTRTPLRLAADVAEAARSRRRLGAGLGRFAGGLVLLVGGGLVARPSLPTASLYTVVETVLLAVAILVEQLIGPELRARARR